MKTCFSEGKLMKQFGNSPLSKRTPPISEQFFHDPLLCPNFKNNPLPLVLGGRWKLCSIFPIPHSNIHFTHLHLRIEALIKRNSIKRGCIVIYQLLLEFMSNSITHCISCFGFSQCKLRHNFAVRKHNLEHCT